MSDYADWLPGALLLVAPACLVVAVFLWSYSHRPAGVFVAGLAVLAFVSSFGITGAVDERRDAARDRLARAADSDLPVVMRSDTTDDEPFDRTEAFGYRPVDPKARTPRVLWDADLISIDNPDLVVGVVGASRCISGLYVAESAEEITVAASRDREDNRVCVPLGDGEVIYFLVDLAAPVGDRRVVSLSPDNGAHAGREVAPLDLR